MSKLFQKLASQLVLVEDGKSKVNIGDGRELLSKLAELEAKHIHEGKPMAERPLRIIKLLANDKLAAMRKEKK